MRDWNDQTNRAVNLFKTLIEGSSPPFWTWKKRDYIERSWERIGGNVKPINPFFYRTSLPFLEGLLNLNMFVVIGTAAYQNRHAVSQLYGNRVRARRWGF